MSVRIRLARGGSKKRPFHKIVVADKRSPRDGRFIEQLGFYNPLVVKENPEHLKLDVEKTKEWLAKGAEPTDRVARLLASLGVIEMPVIPTQTKKPLPKEKAQMRMKEAEEKAQAKREAEEAARLEAEAAAAAAETADENTAEETVEPTSEENV